MLVAVAAVGIGGDDTAEAYGRGGHRHFELALARFATARYLKVDNAIDAGYVPAAPCTESPAGAMGIHYMNPSLVDDHVQITKPEVLLYLPDDEGHLRLIGLEYFQPDGDGDLGTDEDRPELFGQPFAGPMPGHDPSMPVHYDLHVWVWSHNPDGVFAEWNPRLSCP
jgi:hypothetical protein